MSYITHRFYLDDYTKDLLQDMEDPFGYNGFGKFLFYRTYSRNINGYQENWADCVTRVIEGIMSIRLDYYIKNHISWDNNHWKQYASKLAISLHKMHWSPSGRGLWAQGTDFIYKRGSMSLYSCAATEIHNDLSEDIAWIMDSLMLGVGVGFSPIRDDSLIFKNPKGSYEHVIEDSREGWVDSGTALIDAYKYGISKPKFIYDELRDYGEPIKGFGGIASGPEPLKRLHNQYEEAIEKYMIDKYYDSVIFKTDMANQIGCCVVAGNVRRSAEQCSLSINDPTFINLKNYNMYPQRAEWGWMSNNSVNLEYDEDFEKLELIANRVIANGEPGYVNLQNVPYGRIGKQDKIKKDKARNFNPCFEIPLEGGFDRYGKRVREVCNVDETYPTMCSTIEEWYKACEYAIFYCNTVSLLPTHQPSTNRVVARNRRKGVSIVDFTGWIYEEGSAMITKYLRKGYKLIRKIEKQLANEAGVPEGIRVTTIKPGGTVPKLAGKTSGAGYPNFEYMIRRVRVGRGTEIHNLLVEAGISYEADYVSHNTDVFEWPIKCGPAPPVSEISVWQQAMNLVLLQREWADNAVSNTLMFKPKWKLVKRFSFLEGCNKPFESTRSWLSRNTDAHTHDILMSNFSKLELTFNYNKIKIIQKLNEQNKVEEINIYEYDPSHEEHSIEPLLSAIAPLTKSVSLLPYTNRGVYMQMPEEGITKAEYEHRIKFIRKIDWSKLSSSDGDIEVDKFCSGDKCEI